MDRALAEEILTTTAACNIALNACLRTIEQRGTPADVESVRRAIAPILWKLFETVSLPLVFVEYPELIPPGLEDSVAKMWAPRRGKGT
jgi:hypothetical protein